MIIKKFRRNKILKNNLRNSILHNKNIVTNKFNINKYLTVKLENNKTNIYVEGVYFSQCKYLLFEVPTNEPNLAEEIDSIDDASEKLNNYLEKHDNRYLIPPEVDFLILFSAFFFFEDKEYN